MSYLLILEDDKVVDLCLRLVSVTSAIIQIWLLLKIFVLKINTCRGQK